ncbi:MAG: MFS transporter [Candidatus Baltobacteraceae bacterium]
MRERGSTPISPARIGAFTFGIQIVWGAILAVSLQARSIDLAGTSAVATYSAIAAVGAACATVVQVLAGIAADRRRARVGHRREFYAWGIAFAVPALVWFYLAPNVGQLMLAFFALEIALNVATGPYQAAIPDHVPATRNGEASSWMSAWQSLGNAVGLLVAGFVHDLRAVAVALAAGLLGAFGVTYAHVRALPSLSALPGRFRLDRTFTMLLISRGIVNVGFFTLLGYLLFFVRDSLGIPGAAGQTQTALLFLTFTLAAVGGAALAARPADRFDKRLVATVANVAIALALGALAPARSLAVAYPAAALAGLAWGAFFTADWALACALLPRGAMATAMGVWNVATAGPQIVAPLLAGPLVIALDTRVLGSGPRGAIVLALVEFLIGTALLWTLPRSVTFANQRAA